MPHGTTISPPASSHSSLSENGDMLRQSTQQHLYPQPDAPFASLRVKNNKNSTTMDLLEKIRADLANSGTSFKSCDRESGHHWSDKIGGNILREIKTSFEKPRHVSTPNARRNLSYSFNSTTEDLKTSASTPMIPVPHDNQRTRLGEINAHLEGFERTLEQRTLTTVQAETTRVQLFKEAIVAIEKKVNNEIRQRIESHKLLKNAFDQQVQRLTERLENHLVEKLEKFNNLAKGIESRVTAIEQSVGSLENDETTSKLREEIEKSLLTISGMETQMIASLEERQRIFLDRLTAIEKAVDFRFAEEKTKRCKKLEEIKQESISFQNAQKARISSLQSCMLSEITNLRELISKEREAREQSDDDIVAALKQYTLALHGALSGQLEDVTEGPQI